LNRKESDGLSWRKTTIQGLNERPEIPVLILGGGINGLGLFRELALQGVDCLVVDRDDFVAGASSKSSRMIHGGLRYLENREFRLVREALAERNRLLENARHYVSPLETFLPLFSYFGGLVRTPLVFLGAPLRPGGRGAVVVKAGLTFYDFFTRKNRKTPRHRFSFRKAALRAVPGLNPAVKAAATYWDARITQAERFCIELIQDARTARPSCRALNYVELKGAQKGALLFQDRETGETFSVRPRIVVNATGAWVDRTNELLGFTTRFMGGTKGSHLVVDNKQLLSALGDRMIYYEYRDGRICIAFGFMGKVIMGSTDIPVSDPDAARCDEEEVEYMLETIRSILPGIPVSRDQIVYKFCGVRPLPAEDADVPGRISRDHKIEIQDPEGERTFPVFSLVGGKLTTFRALAEQTADRLIPRLGSKRKTRTDSIPIGGGKNFPADREPWIERVAAASNLTRERVSVLLDRYGTTAESYALSVGSAGETPLETLPGYTVEEIERIAAEEYVAHLTDLVCRRSVIALLGHARPDALRELAKVVGNALGWREERTSEEVESASAEIES